MDDLRTFAEYLLVGVCAKHRTPWTPVCMSCAVYEPEFEAKRKLDAKDADLAALRARVERAIETLMGSGDVTVLERQEAIRILRGEEGP